MQTRTEVNDRAQVSDRSPVSASWQEGGMLLRGDGSVG